MKEWDERLDEFRMDNRGKVVACRVKVIPVEEACRMFGQPLEPGDKVFRVGKGRFFDEDEAHLETWIEVDAALPDGSRAVNEAALHGWPREELPEMAPECPVRDSLADGPAKFFMGGGNFAPKTALDLGPYWVAIEGKSDIAVGFGLPGNRHVCYSIAYEQQRWGVEEERVEEEKEVEEVKRELAGEWIFDLRITGTIRRKE